MTRILIATGLYPPDIGGPATYSKALADLLPPLGVSIEVVSFGEFRKYWPIIRHIAYFAEVLKRGKETDAIYAQDTVSVGIPAAFANLFLRKKFLVRVPGDHVWEQGTRRFGVTGPLEAFPRFSWKWHPYLWVMRFLQQLVIRSADAVVVPSAYLQSVVRRWDVIPRRVILIYNGVEEIEDPGNKQVLRGMLKFQGKLIISVGRLVPWKGFDELIALMPRLKRKFPDLKLLIAGDGPLFADLEKQAESLGVGADVIFTGVLERDVLLRYIRIADVFVLNSRYEGLSHQLLEVMAVGVPVVATKAGGNPEVIDHNQNGFLVRVGAAGEIEKHVEALLANAELRAKIVAAARRKVKQFSRERMAEETVKLLKKVCAS